MSSSSFRLHASIPDRAVVREVGLRDGLQSLPGVMPTFRKLAWIQAAHAAGVREIEVGSFVPARLLPQLADTAELVAFARSLPGLFVSVLVPNLRGAQAALESQADLMLVPLSASREHSLANLRKAPDDVVADVARMRAARDAAGSRTLIEGGVGTAFGCTLQGEVAHSEVLRLLRALLDAGALVSRCNGALRRAALQLLDDNAALREEDVDVLCCELYGFPVHRGGPLYDHKASKPCREP